MRINQERIGQNGFGTVEGLIVLVVVMLISFGGYYVYHRNKTTKSSTNTTSTAQSSNSSKKSTLYVKEWNVSLQYSGSVHLTYSYTPNYDSYVFISSTELSKADSKCDAAHGGIGTLNRSKPGEVAHISGDFNLTGDEYLQKHPDKAGKIGDYVYSYLLSDPPTSCATTTNGPETINALESIFK
ncbi:MAG TPA: hypothetical protein VLG37_00380 [Candidatus Saccharimonadales bacterium]|nr:hypothetical protein [Candidatus Saccharimonadales bacterium]